MPCEKRNYDGTINVYDTTDDNVILEEYPLSSLYYCRIGQELVDPSVTVCKTTNEKNQTI